MISETLRIAENFDDLGTCSPSGFVLSERIIDPVILICREGEKIVARLAGSRVYRGTPILVRALTNRHGWVLDGTTIRPLPRDVSKIFSLRLGCNEADPRG